MTSDPLTVRCPCCRATLTVEGETGEVLMHKEAKSEALKTDLTEAVRDLKKGVGKRDEIFKKSLEAEKHKGDMLKKKFNEAFKRAQEDPGAAPPPREIDLD